MPKGIYQHKKGFNLSEETKRKIGNSHKGKVLSEETKQKIRETFIRIGKNKPFGIPDNRKGKHHTQETRNKMREIAIKNGNKPPGTKGKKLSEKHRLIAIKNLKPNYWLGKKRPDISKIFSEFNKGRIPWNKGLKFLDKEKHYNWQDGKSFEPYGLEFNEDLREVIRNRDRRKCQICEKTELENKTQLSVHHIDYNKKNNNPNNLISLCVNCHTKTNFGRENWINYFR